MLSLDCIAHQNPGAVRWHMLLHIKQRNAWSCMHDLIIATLLWPCAFVVEHAEVAAEHLMVCAPNWQSYLQGTMLVMSCHGMHISHTIAATPALPSKCLFAQGQKHGQGEAYQQHLGCCLAS